MARTNSPADAFTTMPGALSKIGCALMGSGQKSKALALTRQALAERPDDPELLSAVRVVLSHTIPQWHGPMLLDGERNTALERAITRAAASGRTLLDIGAGSGLLSLMAARAGFKAVYACEVDKALAETAQEIVDRNGYADVIRIFAKRSTELNRDADLGGGVDVILAEVFSDDLLNEGALSTFRHASAALALPGAQIIPASASIRLALAFHDKGLPDLTRVEGFDLSPFQRHLLPETKVSIGDEGLHLRSEPTSLFHFNLLDGGPFRNERGELRMTAAGGPANGIVRWIRLRLDNIETYENEPGVGRKSHWAALFSPFHALLPAGQSVTVHAAHDQERVHIWFS